jgi:pimeloyl-ACP methyl ester carboxylesterase
MPYIAIEDARLFYARHSPTAVDGPLLLLIHGAGGSHLDWPAQLRRIPGVQTLALDLPGHGRSTGPGLSTVEDYAAAVAGFINQLELTGVILGGHSLGGAIALELAIQRLPHLQALVLFGSGARLRVLPELLGSLPDNPTRAIELIIARQWSPNAPPQLVQLSRRRLKQVDPAILLGDLKACNQFDIMNALGEVQLPTLAITGTADRMTPLKYAQFLANTIPNARAVAIEEAGHQLMLEKPEEVAAAVVAFLNEVTSGPAT